MEELRRLLREFSKNYGEKGREVAETAERLIAEGMTPDEAVKEAFRLCGVEEWLADNVNTVLLETAQSALPEEAVSLITAEEMLRSLASPWDGSGMTLSEKLHGTAEDMRKRIADTVKDQLRGTGTSGRSRKPSTTGTMRGTWCGSSSFRSTFSSSWPCTGEAKGISVTTNTTGS